MKKQALLLSALVASTGFAADLCAGKAPGSVTFFDQEISRDAALPRPVTLFDARRPMFALMCLTDAAGPQASGGEKFRVVMYVDGRQKGVLRPLMSKPRKDVIVAISEDFDDQIKELDSGKHELRIQAATETGTGKRETEINLDTGNVHTQELRKAGYVADGRVAVNK